MKTPGAKKIGKGDSILSFEQSTVEIENDEDFIQDRIINRKRAWRFWCSIVQILCDLSTSFDTFTKTCLLWLMRERSILSSVYKTMAQKKQRLSILQATMYLIRRLSFQVTV